MVLTYTIDQGEGRQAHRCGQAGRIVERCGTCYETFRELSWLEVNHRAACRIRLSWPLSLLSGLRGAGRERKKSNEPTRAKTSSKHGYARDS